MKAKCFSFLIFLFISLLSFNTLAVKPTPIPGSEIVTKCNYCNLSQMQWHVASYAHQLPNGAYEVIVLDYGYYNVRKFIVYANLNPNQLHNQNEEVIDRAFDQQAQSSGPYNVDTLPPYTNIAQIRTSMKGLEDAVEDLNNELNRHQFPRHLLVR